MQLKLTPRLKKIAEMVPISARVADVGTDHGYIPIYLVKNNIASRVIACDINENPLQSAKENIKQQGLMDKIMFRLGSGLEVLTPGEVDTIIIAGMGGLLISEILENSTEVVEKASTFILQPMQAQDHLRKYLVNNNFEIIQDVLVKEDHKIYEILKVVKGKQEQMDDIYYEIGFFLHENPRDIQQEFLEGKIKILEDILNNVQNKVTEGAMIKHIETKEKLNKIKEVQECLRR